MCVSEKRIDLTVSSHLVVCTPSASEAAVVAFDQLPGPADLLARGALGWPLSPRPCLFRGRGQRRPDGSSSHAPRDHVGGHVAEVTDQEVRVPSVAVRGDVNPIPEEVFP